MSKNKKSITIPEETYWSLLECKARLRKETWEEFFEYIVRLVKKELEKGGGGC